MFTERKRTHSLKQLPNFKLGQSLPNSKLLPNIGQPILEKKSSPTRDLTNIISKFTHQLQKQQLKYSEQLARNAISVLRTFSQIQNNFQSLFGQLYEVLRRFIFVISDQQIENILTQYRVRTGFSFRKTCLMLDAQLENVMKQKNLKLTQVQQQLATLRNTYHFKITQWQTQKFSLESQIDYFKKLSNIQYTKSLQQKVQNLTMTLTEQQVQLTRLNKQNQQMIRQIDAKDNKIYDQQYQIAKLKSDLFDARDKLDKTDIYFAKMRDRFDQLLVKMMGLKQVIAKVQQQNSLLISERIKMVNRAAVAFEDLTPRPKYNQLFNMPFKSNSHSTKDIFAMLVSSQTQQNKKSIIKIIKQRKQNTKLQQAQAIRDKVVDNIISAKKQMDSLQGINQIDNK